MSKHPADVLTADNEVNYATGDDLRVQVHEHLRQYPGLTAYEIARALHLPWPQGGGQDKVRRQLRIMAADGEASGVTGPRGDGDRRTAVRWVAT
jgi:hypothetical protein